MKVNGNTVPATEGMTVHTLLEQQGYPLTRIAVEVNGTIVRKHSTIPLRCTMQTQ